MVGPLQAVRYRNVSGREVDQAAGNEERRHPPRPSLLKRDRRLGDAGKTADARADHHTGLDLIVVAGGLPACVIERLAGGTQRKDDEIVDLALLLRLHPMVGIEAAVRAIAARNLASDLRRQIGHVESLDSPRAAVAVDEPPPGRLDAASERRHHAEPRDDDASHLLLLHPPSQYHIPPAPRRAKAISDHKSRGGPCTPGGG